MIVEFHEQGIVAKVHLIEIVISLREKLLVKGVGNKTDSSNYLEHPVPLFLEGFGKQAYLTND